jgi:uncharacterized membrane protein (UPF0127 family)
MRTSLVALILATAAACEPRIEELPSGKGSRRDPDAWVSAEPSSKRPKKPEPEAKCIRPSPPEPARKLARDGGPAPDCPADPDTPPKLRTGRVVFVEAKSADADAGADAGTKSVAVKVEIAEKNPDRMRGLMYRTEMAEDHGMIFRFEARDVQSFWMRNTCIPLDMLFIDDDGTIVGIEENVPTLNDETYSCGCRSKYVLELNAGWSRRHGVVAGQRVRLEGI